MRLSVLLCGIIVMLGMACAQEVPLYLPTFRNVMGLAPAPSGMWVATYGSGIYQHVPQDWRSHYRGNPGELPVTDITRAQDGKLYATTFLADGILVIDPRSGSQNMLPWPATRSGFTREHRRAIRLAPCGKSLLITTLAGYTLLTADRQWKVVTAPIDPDAIAPVPDGCWIVLKKRLTRLDAAGNIRAQYPLTGLATSEVTSLRADDTQVFIGLGDGALYCYNVRAHTLVPVAGAPRGIAAALLAILPRGNEVFLAYGTPCFPAPEEGLHAGGLAVYDQGSHRVSVLPAYTGPRWRALALTGGYLWAGGAAGVTRFAVAPGMDVPTRGQSAIRYRAGEHILLLSRPMRTALQGYAPSFTCWRQEDYVPDLVHHYPFSARQAPFAVLGDFNGDGRQDAALDGVTRHMAVELCLLSQGAGYRVIEISRTARPRPSEQINLGWYTGFGRITYFSLVPPGRYATPFESAPITITTEAFARDAYEKASVMLYYRNGRFQEYTLSD